MKTNIERFIRRTAKVRARINGSSACPRLAVYRSNRFILVQAIDDDKKVTLAASSQAILGKTAKPADVGGDIAKKLLAKKIKKVVFDRRGYRYHGRVKELAEAARKGGLKF